MIRFNQVGIVLGYRGTGKTLFLLGSKYSAKPEDKPLNIPSLIDIQLKNGFKVLIIDTMEHPAYKGIPVLETKQFSKFNKGVARIFTQPEYMRELVNLINRTPSFNNTFIVFEDAGRYTEQKLPIEFKRLISETKQRNIDVLFMYHCWADTPLDIFRKGIDYIQLFKTEDHPLVRKNNLRLYDKILSIYSKVKANSSRFFGIFIDTSTN